MIPGGVQMIRIRYFFCFLLSCYLSASVAQESIPFIQKLNVGNGLSHNLVTKVLKDQKGFMWFPTQYGLNRFDGRAFIQYFHNPADTTSIDSNFVYDIEKDETGHLWLALSNGAVDRFDPVTEIFHHFTAGKTVRDISIDPQGGIWAGTADGLAYKKPNESAFQAIPNPGLPSGSEFNIYNCLLDRRQRLWVISRQGLYRYAPIHAGDKHVWELVLPVQPAGFDPLYNWFQEDNQGKIWLGGNQGLFFFDEKTNYLKPYLDQHGKPAFKNGLSYLGIDSRTKELVVTTGSEWQMLKSDQTNNGHPLKLKTADNGSLSNFNHVFIDDQGLLWVATSNEGVFYIDPRAGQFHWFDPSQEEPSADRFPRYSMIVEDERGVRWFASENGVEVIFPNGGNIYPHLDRQVLKNIIDPVSVTTAPDGVIWVGTPVTIVRIDALSGKLTAFDNLFSRSHLGEDAYFSTADLVDQHGNFWSGFWGGGLVRFPKEEQQDYEIYPCGKTAPVVNECYIQSLMESQDGTIWIGTVSNGAIAYDPVNKTTVQYNAENTRPNGLANNYIRALMEDQKGQIWMGTYGGGVSVLDRKTGVFKNYNRLNYLTEDLIESIVEDRWGIVWIATTSSMTRFDPVKETFHHFTYENGLPKAKYNRLSPPGPVSGEMVLSTDQGYVIFQPGSISIDTVPPNTAIVKMNRYRRDMENGGPIEEKGMPHREHVELSYQDYLVTFEFAVISFFQSNNAIVEYKLEGFNEDWIQLGAGRQASFTSLPAGDYTLLVRGTNADGVKDPTPARLSIGVSPPWWDSWWAYGLYLLLAVGAAAFFRRRELRRLRLQNQLEKEQLEAAKLRELDQAKTWFFTNISHEFRTPLTVILGMAEEIREPDSVKRLIRQNGQNLLRLVNQILDLGKLDAGKLELHLQRGDLIIYLRYILESFRSLARHKKVELVFAPALDQLEMDFDEEKMQHIVSNLLSNALKFTPGDGKVSLLVEEVDDPNGSKQVVITVKDTGIGISAENLSRIFDRYFQGHTSLAKGEPGSGIGLTLVKELVELMGGAIQVESEEGKGTGFKIFLPITRQAKETAPLISKRSMSFESLPFPPIHPPSTSKRPPSEELPNLLIIEDNPDVITYMATVLEGRYNIDVAENGTVGIGKALGSIPDIIISDVMMPYHDGFAVTKTLKNDERTSHIPIVLLTARADAESRLEGLERGPMPTLPNLLKKKSSSCGWKN